MHDLLTRLKAHARHRGLDVGLYGECDATLSEAAAEIERLQTALHDIANHLIRVDTLWRSALNNEQKAD